MWVFSSTWTNHQSASSASPNPGVGDRRSAEDTDQQAGKTSITTSTAHVPTEEIDGIFVVIFGSRVLGFNACLNGSGLAGGAVRSVAVNHQFLACLKFENCLFNRRKTKQASPNSLIARHCKITWSIFQ